ncbi:hypothetical protein Q5H92_26445 [Hymenobacter sp. M29]|uniref:Uncharacterized protein n=1 Tax=Hymenobacter mellowenesis TaxID=3063995 RepID=A0ABT9AJ80_9BACT|nr:hypothetical protein [Hymenobacter sp. M29]MDO7849927.1 hypothetical protein [Hymenobacter sp. M29]
MARTAHEFTPRPASQMTKTELRDGAERSVLRMLLAMGAVMLLALLLAYAESRTLSSSAEVEIGHAPRIEGNPHGWHYED